MNNNAWIIPYVILSIAVFISSTLFLSSTDHPKLVPRTVTIISYSPTQVNPSDPAGCINDLFNQFQAGNLDPDSLREDIDRCLGLNSNGGDNGDNNTQIMPPQTPNGTTPRFV